MKSYFFKNILVFLSKKSTYFQIFVNFQKYINPNLFIVVALINIYSDFIIASS